MSLCKIMVDMWYGKKYGKKYGNKWKEMETNKGNISFIQGHGGTKKQKNARL